MIWFHFNFRICEEFHLVGVATSTARHPSRPWSCEAHILRGGPLSVLEQWMCIWKCITKKMRMNENEWNSCVIITQRPKKTQVEGLRQERQRDRQDLAQLRDVARDAGDETRRIDGKYRTLSCQSQIDLCWGHWRSLWFTTIPTSLNLSCDMLWYVFLT